MVGLEFAASENSFEITVVPVRPALIL